MNERIKLLAEQAVTEKLSLDEFIAALKKEPHDFYGFRRCELEKFAELIVGECMDIIRQEWFKENNSEVDRQDTRSIAIHVGKKLGVDASLNAVTKHFGVEYE